MIKVTTLTAGAPDLLDAWLESDADLEARIEQDWADWAELTYDPDDPYKG